MQMRCLLALGDVNYVVSGCGSDVALKFNRAFAVGAAQVLPHALAGPVCGAACVRTEQSSAVVAAGPHIHSRHGHRVRDTSARARFSTSSYTGTCSLWNVWQTRALQRFPSCVIYCSRGSTARISVKVR